MDPSLGPKDLQGLVGSIAAGRSHMAVALKSGMDVYNDPLDPKGDKTGIDEVGMLMDEAG